MTTINSVSAKFQHVYGIARYVLDVLVVAIWHPYALYA